MAEALMLGPVEKLELLYEGKAKRMWTTADAALLVMEYKDSLTAFDAQKKGQFGGKGSINNRISALLMGELARLGIENNFVRLLDANNSLVRRVSIVPIEVIVRYEAHGSICKRYGIPPGLPIDPPLCEIGLKNDELHDPYFTDDIAALMGLATREELLRMRYMALVTGEKLREIYGRCGIEIKDFKLEFGRLTENGKEKIILADEVTPDTCRLVDKRTGEKLDKDLFRFDLGDVDAGYHKLLEMIEKVLA
jgi:phosphoribosylaminoimidazole-succinocarboxamide synthase